MKLQDRWRSPFLIRVPLVDVDKGGVTDARLSVLMAGSGRNVLAPPAGSRVRQVRFSEDLPDGALAMIEDIHQHPDDGVKARYARLGFSVDRSTPARKR